MSIRQLIPEDLAELSPGPELARVLAGIELSRLSGFDCVRVLKAQYRQARVFSEWTTDLSPEQARAVCDALLPRLSKLTTGQLIEQIKRMAIAIDPDWGPAALRTSCGRAQGGRPP